MIASASPLLLLGLFFGGLIIGSFLNVVIYRLPLMMEHQWHAQCSALLANDNTDHPSSPIEDANPLNLALPSSHCPQCKTPIKYRHNIPVLGYILLRGRCAACQASIPARYPVIELSSALVAVVCGMIFGPGLPLIAALAISGSLICLTAIDIDHQLLPDVITLPLLWSGLLYNTLSPAPFATQGNAILGAAAGYLVLWTLYQTHKALTGKEGMGYGDFKLTAAAGAWLGWQALPLILLLSAGLGAIIGLFMLSLRQLDRDVRIAFGPYLALAFWVYLLWGDSIIAAYFNILANSLTGLTA